MRKKVVKHFGENYNLFEIFGIRMIGYKFIKSCNQYHDIA